VGTFVQTSAFASIVKASSCQRASRTAVPARRSLRSWRGRAIRFRTFPVRIIDWASSTPAFTNSLLYFPRERWLVHCPHRFVPFELLLASDCATSQLTSLRVF
jgi:hypothetical protein